MEDPRDGLSLFGPLDQGKPAGIRTGVIGTKKGIEFFRKWVEQIQGPISNRKVAYPPFPGFEAAFGITLRPQPVLCIQIDDKELSNVLYIDDPHQRVFQTVELFSSKIIRAIKREESKVEIWFVIIPDAVHKYCRPKSVVETKLKIKSTDKMSVSQAKKLINEPSLFEEANVAAKPYLHAIDFRHQLKARLLSFETPTQIIRESTLAYEEFKNAFGKPRRDLSKLQSAIAWNICTTAFYKTGGRPWKITDVRPGVCYIGIVFKIDSKGPDEKSACCAAQMFLDSGDGMVFRGAVGPWYVPGTGDFHLSRFAAKELVELALDTYKQKIGGAPKELFLHGRVKFDDEEWIGFQSAVNRSTRLVGIQIREESAFRIYRKKAMPVLRGLAHIKNQRMAHLWTRGFIPRLQTYPGREVPRPLFIYICRGNAQMEIVLKDIMALTKLNYNACIFADGVPVTLKFANAVGEILTSGPIDPAPPLPFRYYI